MKYEHENLLVLILEKILREEEKQTCLLEKLEHLIQKDIRIDEEILGLVQSKPLTGFNVIKEITMVPLAAGQTAIFATTPIPSTSVPVPASLVWTSSDTTNAPVTPNAADPSGLSIQVVFPPTVAAGVTFTLTLTYTNTDGTTATQANEFTTVAPASPDITGFEPIVQTA